MILITGRTKDKDNVIERFRDQTINDNTNKLIQLCEQNQLNMLNGFENYYTLCYYEAKNQTEILLCKTT